MTHAVTACVLTTPNVRSLGWLARQLDQDAHLYPGSASLRRIVDGLVSQMPDEDACAPLASGQRVPFNGRKLMLLPLLYRLCTPEQCDLPTTRMRPLCKCASLCANPRHWLPLTLFRQREREMQRNQYGNTRLTEAILAAHHPCDPTRPSAAPRRLIYKRMHLYVRVNARAYAHIAPVRQKSELVGVYTLPPPPPAAPND
jgi:hypothetical protein